MSQKPTSAPGSSPSEPPKPTPPAPAPNEPKPPAFVDSSQYYTNGVTTPFMADNQTLATAPGKLTRKRRLTVDVVNIQKLGELLCMTQSELYTKELPSTFHPSGKATTYCVDVVNLLTGEEYMLACNTVLASALQRAGQPLVGRYFAMRSGEMVAGKRYRRVDVVEVEPVQ